MGTQYHIRKSMESKDAKLPFVLLCTPAGSRLLISWETTAKAILAGVTVVMDPKTLGACVYLRFYE
jgi:hypothetical protein